MSRLNIQQTKNKWNVPFATKKKTARTSKKIPTPDIAVSMGCDVGCPFIGRAFDEDWRLPDPTGKSDDEFITVITEIENKIKSL